VPHYLFDFVKPMNSYTAGDYREDTLRVLGDLNKHDYPGGIFITGGSGFYLKALENGMFPTDEVSADVKDQIKSWEARSHSLHKELSSLDPEHAKKISENDGYRVRRSLGLVLTHKTTMLKIQQQFEQQKTPFPYAIKKIGLSIHRDELRKRVQSRVDKMLELGLIDEVKGHLDSGLREWSPLKSVGYKEVVNYLDDLWDLKEMKERLVINTMQLAKRQRTWFQKDKSIQWYDVLKDKSELEEVCK